MKMVRLTSPDGDPVFVNPDTVQTVRTNKTGMAAANAKAVLLLTSGATQGVFEELAEVVSRLESHEGAAA
jgi:uncharacterized protein YlzI (FlbEa/FlbD family)